MIRPQEGIGLLAVLATIAFPLLAWPSGTIEVAVVAPPSAEPVFGEVAVVVSVNSLEPVRKIELFVDGRFAGAREAPPYEWTVDVGEENRRHRFEAIAENMVGERAQSLVETPALGVDDAIDVELQQIYVTARRGESLVTDLQRHEISVLDDGEPQRLITFEGGDVPLTVMLAVDASHSMRGERLEVALAAARSFVRRMHPLDRASLLLFAERILYTSPFTGFREVLGTGLDRVEAQGGTALGEHLYIALKQLDAQQGRRVLILLTDGFDTTSALGMRDVLWSAQRSQAMVYWLRLRDPARDLAFSSAWHDSADYRDELQALERIVRDSGGSIVPLADTHEAEAAFTSILEELRSQYVIGYYPTAQSGDGRWRQVRVHAARRGVRLRYRDGYLDH